ncbi:kxDL motif-containing protein CG10681 [Lycorma delicatula]|uniref:kxDL motif-containing protein CG10681 n=1 Tax=Lycorma delicatula TaxID=130591 RepID=UPI003F50E50A
MAENTPESDLGSIECFQNYTAPEVFIQGLAGIVDQQDVESMIRAQKQMLQRFEKTNEMLLNCNSLSVNRLKVASAEFKKHTQLLVDMRKDLDNIFKRIRTLKTKLNNQYPQAFTAAVQSVVNEEDEDETAPTSSNDKERIDSITLGKPKLSKSADVVTSHVQQQASRTKSYDDKNNVKGEAVAAEDTKTITRSNSSSTDNSINDNENYNDNNDSSPYTSDTG